MGEGRGGACPSSPCWYSPLHYYFLTFGEYFYHRVCAGRSAVRDSVVGMAGPDAPRHADGGLQCVGGRLRGGGGETDVISVFWRLRLRVKVCPFGF